jgi:mRNA interferase RelE/StbE
VHEIYIERTAERDLKRLPAGAFARVVARIRALAANPRPEGSRKISGSERDWRIRIGDYRVVYEVDDEASVVRVMRVRHRSEVYR